MKANMIRTHARYFRMALILPVVAALSLATSFTADAKVKHHNRTASVTIGAQAYNSEGHSFDRPWPFGPESTQQ